MVVGVAGMMFRELSFTCSEIVRVSVWSSLERWVLTRVR